MGKKLGSTRLAKLASDFKKQRDLKQLTLQIGRTVPRSKIKSRAGTIDGLAIASLMPKSGTPSKVGDRGDVHISETVATVRAYRCNRYAEGRDYDGAIEGDELAGEYISELMPAIEAQIGHDIDMLLLEIASGTGSAADSRDSLNITLAAGEEWDNYASATSKPLDFMEQAVDMTGADSALFSVDTFRALCRHKQLMPLVTANPDAVIMTPDLMVKLAEHLGLKKIVVGRRAYQANGGHQVFDLEYEFKGVAMFTRESNLLRIPFKERRWKEFEEEGNEVDVLMASEWIDYVVEDPNYTVHFTNVLQ